MYLRLTTQSSRKISWEGISGTQLEHDERLYRTVNGWRVKTQRNLKEARYAGLGDWWGRGDGKWEVGPSGDLEDSQGSDLRFCVGHGAMD